MADQLVYDDAGGGKLVYDDAGTGKLVYDDDVLIAVDVSWNYSTWIGPIIWFSTKRYVSTVDGVYFSISWGTYYPTRWAIVAYPTDLSWSVQCRKYDAVSGVDDGHVGEYQCVDAFNNGAEPPIGVGDSAWVRDHV